MILGDDADDGGSGNQELAAVQQEFERRVRLLAARYGPITSRTRSIAKNRLVGGSSRSQHLIGLAADFAVSRQEAEEFARVARSVGVVPVNEMNRPGHGPHMHVQMFPAGQTPARFFGVQISQVP